MLSNFSTIRLFRVAMRILMDILVIYIIVVMAIGLFQTLTEIHLLFTGQGMDNALNKVIIDILTFLVIVELFRSFIEYFEMHRFRLHTLITPALVFVLRELIITLYTHKADAMLLGAYGLVILALGIVRTLGVYYSPSEEEQQDNAEDVS
jgi:uncharacterized membrane protein (DUF373 family)